MRILSDAGEIVSVEGNERNLATGGAVCPVLRVALQQASDPDRVLVPLRRTNPVKARGIDPGFTPISWDEALEEVADRMLALRRAGKAQHLVVSKGRSTEISGLLFSALPDIYGTPNRMTHDTICAEAEKLATGALDGVWDYHDYDFEHVECIVMWGADPLVANRFKAPFLRAFADLKRRARIFVVDPHRSLTAEKAGKDAWVPVVCGCDGALALAMAHVICAQGLWNRSYVGDFADGHNRFAGGAEVDASLFSERHVRGLVRWWNVELRLRDPAWAEEKCGVPAARIIEMARAFAAASNRAVSWVSPGVTMSARGVASGMSCYALNGLVGSIGARGGVLVFPSMPLDPLPDTRPYQDETARAALEHPVVDGRQARGFMAAQAGRIHRNYVTNRLADAILDGDPYPIEMMIAYWNNFAFSCTGAGRWERALAKLPFFVHMTTNISETSHFADIVLPAAHHLLEGRGYATGFVKSRARQRTCISLQAPAVAPAGKAKGDEGEFPYLLAEKLAAKGFPALLDYYREACSDPETGACPRDGGELALAAVKLRTRPVWEVRGGWKRFAASGVLCSDASCPRADDGPVADLPTESGCFEFESSHIARMLEEYARVHDISTDAAYGELGYGAGAVLAPFPHWEEPLRYGAVDEFPLVFSQHRAFASLEGRSANTPLFQDMKAFDPGDLAWDDVVKVHPDDLRRLGMEDGQMVEMSSPFGSVVVRAHAWDGTLRGTVSKCYGQGHWAYGHVAALDFEQGVPRGGNANEILPAAYERMSASTARHGGVVRVKLEPVDSGRAAGLDPAFHRDGRGDTRVGSPAHRKADKATTREDMP